MKSSIFEDMTPCSPLKINRCFGARNQREAGSKLSSAYYLLHAGFLLGLFFDPEDEVGMFLRKVV
jgi:hypothetical protein